MDSDSASESTAETDEEDEDELNADCVDPVLRIFIDDVSSLAFGFDFFKTLSDDGIVVV